MKYVVTNIDGREIHNSNSDAEFIHFMRTIAVENDDDDMSIIVLSEAKEYLEVYCPDLKLN